MTRQNKPGPRISGTTLPALCLVAALLLSAALAAQENQEGPAAEPAVETAGGQFAEETIEEVIVIGSRLRRRDYSSASPVVTIDREAIEFTGQETLETALSQMPQFSPDFDRTANNPGNGRAQINLRGLGSHRTLVMLNGRRLGPSGIGTAVDVNNLPQALIKSAEIITGGASSVYGSDAVAGIVNFTIRDDFDGLGLDLSTYVTEEGDSNIHDLSLAYGHNFANGRGNITVFAGYYDREETYADAREFTSVPWWDSMWTGEITQGGSPRVPQGLLTFPFVDYGDGGSWTIFDGDGNPREFIDPDDRYNWAPWNYLQVPMQRSNAGLLFSYDLAEGRELYVEATWSESETELVLAPIPAGEWLAVNYDNPVLTPATAQLFAENLIPLGGGIGLGRFFKRFEELGPRAITLNSEYTRLLAGMRGDFGSDWEYDAWVTFTENDEQSTGLNDASKSRLQQGLLVDGETGQCFDPSGGCVPVNIFGFGNLSADAIEFIRLRPLSDLTKREQVSVSGFVRGPVFDTWAGPVETVFGGEWRKDDGSFEADPLLFSNDTMGYLGNPPVIGEEQVYEAFAEVLVPLVEDRRFAEHMTLELGYRYSKYDFADSVDTWKIGLDWRPGPGFGFRGMLQRAVRAPNFREAFSEQQIWDDFLVIDDPTSDPCSAASNPVGDGNVEKCIATGLPADQVGVFEASQFPTRFISGGNPDLEPEVADTLTMGFVFTPESIPDLQVSVDYFDIQIEGEIGSLAALEACFDPANSENLFCDQIIRDPVTYNVSEIREFNINRGLLRTTGIDTQINYSMQLPPSLGIGGDGADLFMNVVWTHVRELSGQNTPFSTAVDCAGTFGWPCVERLDGMTWPTDRVTTRLSYVSGDFAANVNWRWIGETDNGAYIGAPLVGIPVSELDLAVPDVAKRNYFDVSFSYAFSDHVMALLTVANLTETDPPLMADWVWDKNTDTRMYDIFGRSYTLSLSFDY